MMAYSPMKVLAIGTFRTDIQPAMDEAGKWVKPEFLNARGEDVDTGLGCVVYECPRWDTAKPNSKHLVYGGRMYCPECNKAP